MKTSKIKQLQMFKMIFVICWRQFTSNIHSSNLDISAHLGFVYSKKFGFGSMTLFFKCLLLIRNCTRVYGLSWTRQLRMRVSSSRVRCKYDPSYFSTWVRIQQQKLSSKSRCVSFYILLIKNYDSENYV